MKYCGRKKNGVRPACATAMVIATPAKTMAMIHTSRPLVASPACSNDRATQPKKMMPWTCQVAGMAKVERPIARCMEKAAEKISAITPVMRACVPSQSCVGVARVAMLVPPPMTADNCNPWQARRPSFRQLGAGAALGQPAGNNQSGDQA